MKIRTPLTSVSTAALFEELTTRVLQLHDDAERPGSAGHMRTLLAEAYEAGRCAGISAKSGEDALALRHLLDEATARMPDTVPTATDSFESNVSYWRNGRQHLWQLVDALRVNLETQGDAGKRQACTRAQRLDERVKQALRPQPPLRQRAGKWLFELGERISQRGAS